jgi:RNA-directed DNA polymerase
MNFEEYKKAFTAAALNSGFSETNVLSCLSYAEILFSNKVPVIYNTTHLAALVGYKKEYLKKAVVYNPKFYRQFEISKRNGKPRTISEPLPSLKEIQTWILKEILNQVPVSPFAKAYRKNITILENVRHHKKQDKILSIDIKDFFTSIKSKSVQSVFESLGYSQLISNLLSKLCTKDEVLPQGAPTSPALSNIYFYFADQEISHLCLQQEIRYTRYADDLNFSGNFDELALFSQISVILKKHDFELNETKTKLMKPGNRQVITGIVVNEYPQIPFFQRNKLRQEMHYIKLFGLENHKQHKKITNANYLQHLLGKINFIVQINPKDKEFVAYKQYLVSLTRTI